MPTCSIPSIPFPRGQASAVSRPIRVAGAGPSGLSAAITLALAGVPVEVYERGPAPGSRHHFDLQGMENFSSGMDIVERLRAIGLSLDCPLYPVREVHILRGAGHSVLARSDQPFTYLVQRGAGPGTLDDALRRQAESLGVAIHCRRPLTPDQADVWATGPAAASVVACGYNFRTEHPPLSVGLLHERLAPGGYVYLLVAGGQGTLAALLFRSFKKARRGLKESRELLERRFDLDMREVRPFGGIGYFGFPDQQAGEALRVGEAGGFQDHLFGFGIRVALVSGHLAARSLLEQRAFDELWQTELGALTGASLTNRLMLELAGGLGHRYLVRGARSLGPRAFLARLYRFGLSKRLLYPLARALLARPSS